MCSHRFSLRAVRAYPYAPLAAAALLPSTSPLPEQPAEKLAGCKNDGDGNSSLLKLCCCWGTHKLKVEAVRIRATMAGFSEGMSGGDVRGYCVSHRQATEVVEAAAGR